MLPSDVLGLAFGVGIGLANVLVSLALYAWARRRTGAGFIHVVLGGMAVRLPLTAAAAAAVLALTDVSALAFVGALMATFVAGLVVETVLVTRDARQTASPADSPPFPSS